MKKIFNKIYRKRQDKVIFNRADWLILTASIVTFIAIALKTMTKFSIWFDEAFSAYLIRFNFLDIAKYTASDVHPPFYYWLLKLWSYFFGNSELALRSMSLFFGCLAIVTAFLLVFKLFGRRNARISLLFLVFSPMFVRYSQEARMYTLVAFIAVLGTLLLTYAMETNKKTTWALYGILVSLGMWTHYFAAIVWISHWIWRADIIRNTAKKGKFIKDYFSGEWVKAHLIAIGLFLPWIPLFLKQIFVVQAFGFWIPSVTPNTIPSFLTNIVYYLNVGEVKNWLALLFITLVVVLCVFAMRMYKHMNSKDKNSYKLLIAMSFLPMIILFIASMPPLRSSFIDRYLIPSVLGISMFIGITLSLGVIKFRKYIQIIIIGMTLLMFAIGINKVWEVGNYNKNSNNSNNTKQIIEALKSKSIDKQAIIASSPWLFYEAVFYESDDNPVYYIEPSDYKYGSLDMLKYNDQFKIKDIDQFENDNEIFWYVQYVSPDNFVAPYTDWIELQRINTVDSKSGKPNYTAVQFRTN